MIWGKTATESWSKDLTSRNASCQLECSILKFIKFTKYKDCRKTTVKRNGRRTCWEQGLAPGGKANGTCNVRWGGTILFFFSTVLSQWAVTQRFPSLSAWKRQRAFGSISTSRSSVFILYTLRRQRVISVPFKGLSHSIAIKYQLGDTKCCTPVKGQ